MCASFAAGEVPKISGGKSPAGQILVGEEVLRGAGDPATKFPPFESVSLQPLCVRKSAVTSSSPGAAPAPSTQFAVPYPTKSIKFALPSGQALGLELVPRGVVVLASATFPLLALMLILPVASGLGKPMPSPEVPAASCTR